MFSIVVGEYTLKCHDRGVPNLHLDDTQHAPLVEEFDADGDQGEKCVLAVQHGLDWPILVVTQRCKHPGFSIRVPCSFPKQGCSFWVLANGFWPTT